jgi:hypothetical protein
MAPALVELPEPVVRLAPCPRCADRRRTLVESAEGMRGHCMGCGRLLSFPLATESVSGSPVAAPRGLLRRAG